MITSITEVFTGKSFTIATEASLEEVQQQLEILVVPNQTRLSESIHPFRVDIEPKDTAGFDFYYEWMIGQRNLILASGTVSQDIHSTLIEGKVYFGLTFYVMAVIIIGATVAVWTASRTIAQPEILFIWLMWVSLLLIITGTLQAFNKRYHLICDALNDPRKKKTSHDV